jgi:hypothetical protein
MQYQGPATITQPIPGRRRQYELEFEGKLFKRDVDMLIPQHTMQEIGNKTVTTQVEQALLQVQTSETQGFFRHEYRA